MSRLRSAPPDHVHYAPGLSGLLRWMGYWMMSRSTNATRTLCRLWRSQLRPALVAYGTTYVSRVKTTLQGTAAPKDTRPYRSLATAVKKRSALSQRDAMVLEDA